MKLSNIETRLFFYDFEVFAHDWLVVFYEQETDYRFIFHNDSEGVVEFLREKKPILCGYNNKHYDQYILKGVTSYYDPEQIKMINDFIIAEGQQGWMYNYNSAVPNIPQIDLMDDVVPRKSLKMLEGAMGLTIVESSIPFDHPTKWTDSELKEITRYCIHDVKALIPLWKARENYLNTKVLLANLGGLDVVKSMGLTNAKLTAWYLDAASTGFTDEREYVYPENLDKSLIPQEVLDFYDQIYDETIDSEILFKSSIVITLFGMEIKLGWGGAHGAIPKYSDMTDGDYLLLMRDLSSYYPGLKIQNDYISRAMNDKSLYEEVVNTRLKAKAEQNFDVADPLKLVANTAFGCLLAEFNPLYDPLMGRSVCITGQLYQIMLLQLLGQGLKEFQPINLNTDGIIFKINKHEHKKANTIVEKFIKLVNIPMDEDNVSLIAQKDVNNYVAVIEGKTKAKGGWVSDVKPSFKSHNLTVVARAIVDYFVDGVDPAETINMCTEVLDFQQCQKVGSTFQKVIQETMNGQIELQRTNRIYAGKDESLGKVKKVKINGTAILNDNKEIIGYKDRLDTLQNCPPRALIDNDNKVTIDMIDKKWYINMAHTRINEFKGEMIMEDQTTIFDKDISKLKAAEAKERLAAREKELYELKQVGTNTSTPTFEGTGIIFKLALLRQRFATHKFELDGYNGQTKNDYVTAHQYAQILNQYCMTLGLEYDAGIVNSNFTQQTLSQGKAWFWTIMEAKPLFTDIETGETKEYHIFVEASDGLDKSSVKCQTMLAKTLLKTSFLVTDVKDGDPEVVEMPKATGFVPNKQQEKITAKVMTDAPEDQKMTETQLKTLVEMIDKISAKNGKPYSAKVKDKAMLLAYTKSQASSFIMKIEDKMEDLGIE